jgi:hypothetical protein
MRADASRARVRRDRGLSEGMLVALRFGERTGLARSRQSKARDNPGHVIRREIRLAQTLGRGPEHRRKALLQPETNIGRTGSRFAEQLSRHGLKASPTERGTAVDAKEECRVAHVRVLTSE